MKKEINKFPCSICKDKHWYFQTIELPLPRNIVLKLLADEFSSQKSDRWMIIDKSIFLIRGKILLPISTFENENIILPWIKVSEKEFVAFLNSLANTPEQKYEGEGQLFYDMTYFEGSFEQKVKFTHLEITEYPVISVVDRNTKLSKAQIEGLSLIETKNFIESMYHSL